MITEHFVYSKLYCNQHIITHTGFQDSLNNVFGYNTNNINGPFKAVSLLSKHHHNHNTNNELVRSNSVPTLPSSSSSSKRNSENHHPTSTEPSIEDLMLILKGLQNKYINNQEPVENADIRVHFDSLNFLRMLNQYGSFTPQKN